MSYEQYESIVETMEIMEIMEDADFMAKQRDSVAQADRGVTVSLAEAKKRVEL